MALNVSEAAPNRTRFARAALMLNDLTVKAIDSQPWLDELSDRVQPAVHDALHQAGAGVKDLLHGTWLGHPLHPVLTDIPVGAWTAAMAMDAVELMSGSEELSGASDFVVGVGLAGALAAAVTGAADWSETDRRARRIGIVHALLNVAATGLYATSLVMRRSGSRRAGIGVSMAGYAIASLSAYLGGHLVFGEQIGVDHTATPQQGRPPEWNAVLRDDELRDRTPRRVEAGGVAVLLIRMNGRIHALTETCSHLGGPLAEGKLDADGITCPWHGSRFCLTDGRVLRGPTTFPARLFDVRVRDNQIEIKAKATRATTVEP